MVTAKTFNVQAELLEPIFPGKEFQENVHVEGLSSGVMVLEM